MGIGAPYFIVSLLERIFSISKSPKRRLMFFGGACTAFLALIGENYAWAYFGNSVPPQYALLIHAFVLIALVEELAKIGLSYGQIVDGGPSNYRSFAILAAWVGAGFAGAENVMSVLGNGGDVVIYRIFTATPFHICNAIVASRLLWLAVTHDKAEYAILAVLIAVFFHGLYDYSILADTAGDGKFWFSLVMTVTVAIGLVRHEEA